MPARFVVGIDEAGRGPLAGPVAVGVVAVPQGFDWALMPGVGDSKKLTPLRREKVYARLRELSDAASIRYAVGFSDAGMIDRDGIVPAIRSALASALASLKVDPAQCDVLLDGGLKAPGEYAHQKTIVRGDASEPVIGLASIAAKVERDRLMCKLALEYPGYGFEVHKGYGTAGHYVALSTIGISPLHRKSFLRNWHAATERGI